MRWRFALFRRFCLMKISFPEYACKYSLELAAKSPRFARQVFASAEEAIEDGFSPDPFGELSHSSKCFGLKQRFPDRVLIMTSDRCFMNCRHCTRRGLLGAAQVVENEEQLQGCIDYIVRRPEIRDVLLSGGDILTLSDDKVMWFVERIGALKQVEIVRVCTRALCTNPSRITDELAGRLARLKKVWVNTQFNCADEVTVEAIEAAAKLIDRGIPVSCQSVLLKGVNDSVDEMLRLFRALSAARIRPYYVFMCDPIAGISHFRVSLEKAAKIESECAARIGGLAMPRFVADLPDAKRKTPVSLLLHSLSDAQ